MDNELLITWTFFMVIALGVDIVAYLLLRLDWKKNGITIIDRFWNAHFRKIDQLSAALQKQIAISVLNYHRSTVAAAPAAAPKEALPEAKPKTPPGEIVPVTVRNVGNLRRVKFTLDMPLDTQVEVRIGATREAGVTVEKREL